MSLMEALIYGLPWWGQALAGATLMVAAVATVARFAGWKAALRIGAVAGVLLAAFAHGRRERQRGWRDRREKEERDAEMAIERAREARAAADASAAAPGRLRDDDGFRRD